MQPGLSAIKAKGEEFRANGFHLGNGLLPKRVWDSRKFAQADS